MHDLICYLIKYRHELSNDTNLQQWTDNILGFTVNKDLQLGLTLIFCYDHIYSSEINKKNVMGQYF